MKTSIGVVIIMIGLGFLIGKIPIGNKQEKIIPQRPFVVISYEPIEYSLANFAIKYTLLDDVGNVFYISEPLLFQEVPRYCLGDTINLKK